MTDNSAFQNTDGADAITVLAAVRHCASSWDSDARLLGNVRAEDISTACTEALGILSTRDRYNSMETALIAIRYIYKNGPRNTASWHDIDDIAAAALSPAKSEATETKGPGA